MKFLIRYTLDDEPHDYKYMISGDSFPNICPCCCKHIIVHSATPFNGNEWWGEDSKLINKGEEISLRSCR